MENENAKRYKQATVFFEIDGRRIELPQLNDCPEIKIHKTIKWRIHILCNKIMIKLLKITKYIQKIGKK